MKTATTLIALSLVALTAIAADKIIPGPKGGKMLDQQTEFYVDSDRKVVITFYGVDLKPVAAGAQTAVVWADAKSGRVKLEMETKSDALVSKTSLPEGDGYNVMVQLKPAPDAKAQNFKIVYHDEPCSKCKRAEYACSCDKHEAHDGGHDDHGHKEGDAHKH